MGRRANAFPAVRARPSPWCGRCWPIRLFWCSTKLLTNLDSLTEAVVKQALARLLQDRTGIIITHRYALAELADQIVILKGGVVAASGIH